MKLKFLFAAALWVVSSCAMGEQAQYLASESTRALNLPFSDAVRVGNMLYLSGQLGTLPGTLDLKPGGMKGQAAQALDNIKAILQANGSSMEQVVKCTVMLADMADWPDFNKVYVTYFPGNKPARSAFGASGLAVGAAVELECWSTV
ncbi:MAG: RidA family protein [Proteobacteria bacterium]|nr:RidA family protein [Pseudomonadota bacterium]